MNSLASELSDITQQKDSLKSEVLKLTAKNAELKKVEAEFSESNAKLIDEHKKILANINGVKAALNIASVELLSIKNSFSFKFGRAVTFIPRKIRDAFKRKK